jgi:hypothetical protein
MLGPECDENWSVEAVSQIIKECVLELNQVESRLFFIDFLINIVVRGRRRGHYVEKLIQRVIPRFSLLPIQLDDVLRSLNMWKKSRE